MSCPMAFSPVSCNCSQCSGNVCVHFGVCGLSQARASGIPVWVYGANSLFNLASGTRTLLASGVTNVAGEYCSPVVNPQYFRIVTSGIDPTDLAILINGVLPYKNALAISGFNPLIYDISHSACGVDVGYLIRGYDSTYCVNDGGLCNGVACWSGGTMEMMGDSASNRGLYDQTVSWSAEACGASGFGGTVCGFKFTGIPTFGQLFAIDSAGHTETWKLLYTSHDECIQRGSGVVGAFCGSGHFSHPRDDLYATDPFPLQGNPCCCCCSFDEYPKPEKGFIKSYALTDPIGTTVLAYTTGCIWTGSAPSRVIHFEHCDCFFTGIGCPSGGIDATVTVSYRYLCNGANKNLEITASDGTTSYSASPLSISCSPGLDLFKFCYGFQCAGSTCISGSCNYGCDAEFCGLLDLTFLQGLESLTRTLCVAYSEGGVDPNGNLCNGTPNAGCFNYNISVSQL